MSMTPSDNWYTNNVDKIIEIVGDAETMEFNQLDFDRVERELFSRAYDEIFKELAQIKKENDLRSQFIESIGNHKFKYGLKGLWSGQARECEAKIREGL